MKTLADFDFSLQPSIKREQIESLHELGFLERRENVILVGPPGVGKTHLAISLAIAAAQSTAAASITARSRTSSTRLKKQPRQLAPSSSTSRCAHPSLLVVDEIGYLPVTRIGAVLFFQLMTRRYERRSTVLTSNKGFEEWGQVFGEDVTAAALIDRLHVNIRGNSYRLRANYGRSCTQPSRAILAPLPNGGNPARRKS